MIKVAVVLGTRPEIIKFSPIIRELERRKINYYIIHTNQHYSENMDRIFFEELELPLPKYNLNVGSGTHGKITGEMLIKIEDVLLKDKPDWVLVEGDTNTVLAGAIAACKLNIKVGHVEAGLRSYDRKMPEELNRVAVDHLSDALFCPTKKQSGIAKKEGIDKEKIFVTGNTIVDAVHQGIEIVRKRKDLEHYQKEKYILVTVHRPSNVDEKNVLEKLLATLEKVSVRFKSLIYFPVHPRTKKQMEIFGLSIKGSRMLPKDPVGYLEMLAMEENAQLIITDSGGIQEEACILHVPCLTLRGNTERPESIDVGANMLVGNERGQIMKGVKIMLQGTKKWNNPFGDGEAAQKIVEALLTG